MTANGVDDPAERPKPNTIQLERQHCPACNTDGQHTFTGQATAGADPVLIYRCDTCHNEHPRQTVKKYPPTEQRRTGVRSTVATPPVPNEVVQLVKTHEVLTGKAERLAQPIDKIEKAAHYNFTDLEPIDVIEIWNLPFHLGTALKYLCRAGRKPGESTIDDLDKLMWYVKRYRDEVVRPQLAQETAEQPQ